MKKKPDKSQPEELAAPAVLKRLQSDAAKFSEQIDECEARLTALHELSPNAKETAQNKEQIARIECELVTARDNFGKTAKILLAYDRGIDSNRKEGEKISVDECKEIWKQAILSIKLAIRQIAIADSQSAALADSPESFYKSHSDNLDSAFDGAIQSAISEGAIPRWMLL